VTGATVPAVETKFWKVTAVPTVGSEAAIPADNVTDVLATKPVILIEPLPGAKK
jgi:hypothetical protein